MEFILVITLLAMIWVLGIAGIGKLIRKAIAWVIKLFKD